MTLCVYVYVIRSHLYVPLALLIFMYLCILNIYSTHRIFYDEFLASIAAENVSLFYLYLKICLSIFFKIFIILVVKNIYCSNTVVATKCIIIITKQIVI